MPNSYQAVLDDTYTTLAVIRRLLREHGRGHMRRYVIAFVLMAVAAACTAFTAYMIGDLVNQAYVYRSFAGIIALGVLVIFIAVLKGVSTYGHAVILSRIGNSIVAENQRQIFDKLLSENLAFFSTRHSSEFIARLTTGAAAATQVLNLLITAIGRDALTLLGLVIVMFVQDPVMSFFTFVVVPPAFYVLRKLIRRIRTIARNQFTGSARLMETLTETLQGLRIVKTFTLEDQMRARMRDNVAAVESDANKFARVSHRSGPLMESLGGIAVALAVTYGGYRVVETGATPGEFFSFITAFLIAYEPAKRLARLNLDLNSNLVGVRILFEILDSPPTEPNDDTKPAIKIGRAQVQFDAVSFAYREVEPVLKNVSFVAEPGRLTALVGPSGSGKSTILNLILRLYETQTGTISIDGQSIAACSRQSLRNQIGYVGQDVFLFRGSVRDNIAFGKVDATEDEIVAAAKAAYAHDFISAFPQGYETPVGEHGLQLSGGQRQRIAIARALIKDAPLVLLDEATAALDSESERQVQEALAHLCEHRTTIAIAHRLSTISHADRILVLENGEVAESGRHDELLRKGGRYSSFYRLQLASQEPSANVVPLASNA